MYRELFYQHELYPIKIKFIDSDSLQTIKNKCPEIIDWCNEKDRLYGHTLYSYIKVKGISWRCIYVIINKHGTLPKVNASVIAHEIIHN